MSEAARGGSTRREAGLEPAYDVIELLFFAYRDFVGDADQLLERYKFGRAHHRVLHFVSRRPGMTVAELLETLKITKQSLARVLRELVEAGFVESRPGVEDRRQRRLHPSDKGRKLALELACLQSARVERALAELGGDARALATAFLTAMIDPDARADLTRRCASPAPVKPSPAKSSPAKSDPVAFLTAAPQSISPTPIGAKAALARRASRRSERTAQDEPARPASPRPTREKETAP
jgi:DNA-binding MarR family transcriptional regulator